MDPQLGSDKRSKACSLLRYIFGNNSPKFPRAGEMLTLVLLGHQRLSTPAFLTLKTFDWVERFRKGLESEKSLEAGTMLKIDDKVVLEVLVQRAREMVRVSERP